MIFNWGNIAQRLREEGLEEYQIEEAKISFEKGIQLLVKMYLAYEGRRLEQATGREKLQ